METLAIRLPRQQQLSWKVGLCLLAVYVIWGSTYLAIRIAVGSMPPFLMAGSRFLVAGVLLFGFLRLRKTSEDAPREPLPTPQQWLHTAMVGALLLVVGNGSVVFAEQYVSSSLTAGIVGTSPLWVAIFSGLLGQWPARREWLGIGLGLIGVLWLNSGGELRANPVGAMALMLAPIGWAAGSVLSTRLNLPKGLLATSIEMMTSGVLLLLLSIIWGEDLTPAVTLPAAVAWVYLVLFGSLIGFSAFMYLIRTVRPALATSYAYVNPVVALSLGAAAGEHITSSEFIGISFAVLGVLLIAVFRDPAPKPT